MVDGEMHIYVTQTVRPHVGQTTYPMLIMPLPPPHSPLSRETRLKPNEQSL